MSDGGIAYTAINTRRGNDFQRGLDSCATKQVAQL